MTTDLAGAVRTAVDEARRVAQAAISYSNGWWSTMPNAKEPRTHDVWDGDESLVAWELRPEDAFHMQFWHPERALAMCDWADDVLRRHWRKQPHDDLPDYAYCDWCKAPSDAFSEIDWPCQEFKILAAAFGVDHA